MTVSPPTTAYPVATSLLAMGLESAPGTPAATFYGVPVSGFTPSNKPNNIEDDSLRSGMVDIYDMQQGVPWATATIPSSPVYLDTFGLILAGIMGDWTSAGTSQSTTWTTTAALTPGAGPIPVTTGTAATSGDYVQVDSATNSEVVEVGSGSTSTSIVLNTATPLRFAHAEGVTVTLVEAPYTHVFSVLNLASSTGILDAQPPSLTLIHKNGLAGSGDYFADSYLYSCLSEVTVTGKVSGNKAWLSWDGKTTSYVLGHPGSAVTASFSGVKGLPAYLTGGTLASSPLYGVDTWTVKMSRRTTPQVAADGQANPYFIGRGPMSADATLKIVPAVDESYLTSMLAGTQAALEWQATKGSGASELGFAITAPLEQHSQADASVEGDFWGWNVNGRLIGSTSATGNSAGYGQLQVTLTNAVPDYWL